MNSAVHSKANQSYDSAKRYYIDQARNYVKHPSTIDWSGEKEIAPFEEANTRGKNYSDLLHFLTFTSLRVGFFLQLFSLAILLFMHHGHGSMNAWTYDFYNISDRLRNSSSLIYSITIVLAMYILGTISLMIFQAFISDNGKYSRGFRSGSKIFQTAITLDLLVLGLRFVSFLYTFKFLEERWWSHLHQTRADFSLVHLTALLHGLALFLYGLALFYMECYHDEGTYEELGWVILGLMSFAGLSEILMSLTSFGAYFSYIHLAGLVVATAWSFSFEPLMHYHMSPLHDRTVNDDILANNYNVLDESMNATEFVSNSNAAH